MENQSFISSLKPSTATPRKLASFIVDLNLTVQQHSPMIPNWIFPPSESKLVGEQITAVLPELTPHQDKIAPHFAENSTPLCITTYRETESTPEYFDIQIEKLQGEPSSYLVSLHAPLSEKSHLETLESKNHALQLLNQASRALTETLDTETVLDRILQVTNRIIGAEGSSVWLWSKTNPGWLVCRAAYYPRHVKSLIGQQLQQGQGIAGWVGLSGESCIVTNVENDERFFPDVDAASGFKTKSLLVVPLKQRDNVLGVLEVVNKQGDIFTEHDLTLAETIAASAAIAIENATLVETLHKQMQDLQAQNEELDAFDHTVAHDLQNPLSLIVGFADVLRQAEVKEVKEEDKAHALNMIMNSAQKMSSIIHELLLLSSIRKVEVQTEPLNMASIVEAAIMRLSQQFNAYEAAIIVPDMWPVAMGHAAWIEEVWENYLSNALKYGGRPPKIELGSTLEGDGRFVRFWVQDNGNGLTIEDQSRLFAPFTRLNQIRVTGQGLGLSIVRRIMEKLDGDVAIDSTVGEGSTFSFILPAADL